MRLSQVDMRGNRGRVGRSKRGNMTTRPFKVLGIQQVAVGAAAKRALLHGAQVSLADAMKNEQEQSAELRKARK